MPVPPQIPNALVLLDYFGIAVFAISDALLAAEKRQALVTFISSRSRPASAEGRRATFCWSLPAYRG